MSERWKFLMKREQAADVFHGLFCFCVGMAALFFKASGRGRMMMLLALYALVWGIACVRCGRSSVTDTLRGGFFIFFGGIALLANLGGIHYSARVLGTVFFLLGVFPLALCFARKMPMDAKFFSHILFVLMGCALVFFAGERGILLSVCVMLFGLCLLWESVCVSYIFFTLGDAKDICTRGGERV